MSWFIEKARRKRNTDACNSMCAGLEGSMLDSCLYDCMQAEGTEFQDAVSWNTLLVEVCDVTRFKKLINICLTDWSREFFILIEGIFCALSCALFLQ